MVKQQKVMVSLMVLKEKVKFHAWFLFFSFDS